MVFEHIPSDKVGKVASEISRLLAPDGAAIFIVPTKNTLVEGHVRVPFAHWVDRNPHLLGKYLSASYLVGVGYWRPDQKRGGEPLSLAKSRTPDLWTNSTTQFITVHG